MRAEWNLLNKPQNRVDSHTVRGSTALGRASLHCCGEPVSGGVGQSSAAPRPPGPKRRKAGLSLYSSQIARWAAPRYPGQSKEESREKGQELHELNSLHVEGVGEGLCPH